MAKYLISFPSAAMVVPDGEWGAVGRDAHALIDEAKAAGVYVFGGGIDEDVPPVLVSADGTVAMGGYPWAPTLDGGFTVLELPSRDEAVAWAARIAKACRCSQELRVFGFDPQSNPVPGQFVLPSRATFGLGDRVRKKSGAAWQGHVVGWYCTKLTPEGYAVQSECNPGSVQISHVAALEDV